MLINELEKSTITAPGIKRNECLTTMFELAPSITECLNNVDIPGDRRIQLPGPLRTYQIAFVIFI